ncbi:unnamed protein product [Caretta caretta]
MPKLLTGREGSPSDTREWPLCWELVACVVWKGTSGSISLVFGKTPAAPSELQIVGFLPCGGTVLEDDISASPSGLPTEVSRDAPRVDLSWLAFCSLSLAL